MLELEDGREIRFRDIRKFGRVGLYVAAALDDPFATTGPEPLADSFTVAAFRRRIRGRKGRLKPLLLDQSFIAGVGNIYADEALWAARLHPLRTARTLRPADERRLWLELRRILAEAVIRRGSSIDDYTAPDGDGEMQEHLRRLPAGGRAVPPLRAADPTDRRRRPGDPLLLVVPAALRRRPGRRAGDSSLDGDAGAASAGAGPELGGEGSLGLTPGRTDAQGGRDPAGRRPRLGRRLGVSILRLTDVHREVGTFVILDSITASIALGDRIGLVGPNGAGKTTLLRIAAGRDEPDAGEVHRKRGLTLGLLAQESHFDDEFMAAPDLRAAVRQGASHLDRMAETLAAFERDHRVEEPPTPTSSTSSRSSAATRSTSASTRRCRASGSRRTSGTSHRRPCRAGSRRAPRSPAS